jgi:hypothetical protein
MSPRGRLALLLACATGCGVSLVSAQDAPVPGSPRTPTVQLLSASPLALPAPADSNSPAVWDLIDGQPRLVVLTSIAGLPSRSEGRSLLRLGDAEPVAVEGTVHGVWMEAVIRAEDGTYYGYYHNEIPADVCGRPDRTVPRIGAARSTDNGLTWHDLGIILEADPTTLACQSANRYFLGGVGDFSVVLDRDGQFAYIFYSQYTAGLDGQGVAVARFAWADRDAPRGAVDVWTGHGWSPPDRVPVDAGGRPDEGDNGDEGGDAAVLYRTLYPVGRPLFATTDSWHDKGRTTDAFWGPSVHWNAFLGQYVMLLNRARDIDWDQEGIYVAFSPRLDDPSAWSRPVKILDGGGWYPQVIGLEPGRGTDKEAGEIARLFVEGWSRHLIKFVLP